jgi:hypothetical protein
MTTRLLAFALASLVPAAAAAQHFHHQSEAVPGAVSVCEKPYTEPVLDPALQGVDWKVTSTANPIAMEHFIQGMTLYYGFNFEDALRNFRKAADLDDQFVMAWWGMALAAGPNINIAIDDRCLALARQWSNHAWTLAQDPKKKLTPEELGLAKALPVRYTTAGIEAEAYAKAMEEVWNNRRPHAEVGALYAESLMDLHPWDLWDRDHKATSPDTQKVIDVLTAVIGSKQDALGANHFWLHAVEAGPDPDSAEKSAAVLEMKVPHSGHLRHMPSHFYMLDGRYLAAVKANDVAVSLDFSQFGEPCKGAYEQYKDNKSCLQLYYGHYYAHNLFFRAVANAFLGQNQAALDDALATREHATRFVANEPGLQRYMAAPYLLWAAFGGWPPILDAKEKEPSCPMLPPDRSDTGCHIARAAYHWARGMAYTTLPKNLDTARTEQAVFRRHHKAVWTSNPTSWGNNKAVAVLAIADEVLQARIDWAAGKLADAIGHLETAVAKEDALVYDEPPQWVFPVRQSLGGAYLARGTKTDLEKAVKAFCIDLREHRENGRSLYGLSLVLDKLGNAEWSAKYHARYVAAWPKPWLSENDLWLLGMPKPAGSGNDAAAGAGEEVTVPSTAAAPTPTPTPDPCS